MPGFAGTYHSNLLYYVLLFPSISGAQMISIAQERPDRSNFREVALRNPVVILSDNYLNGKFSSGQTGHRQRLSPLIFGLVEMGRGGQAPTQLRWLRRSSEIPEFAERLVGMPIRRI